MIFHYPHILAMFSQSEMKTNFKMLTEQTSLFSNNNLMMRHACSRLVNFSEWSLVAKGDSNTRRGPFPTVNLTSPPHPPINIPENRLELAGRGTRCRLRCYCPNTHPPYPHHTPAPENLRMRMMNFFLSHF